MQKHGRYDIMPKIEEYFTKNRSSYFNIKGDFDGNLMANSRKGIDKHTSSMPIAEDQPNLIQDSKDESRFLNPQKMSQAFTKEHLDHYMMGSIRRPTQ